MERRRIDLIVLAVGILAGVVVDIAIEANWVVETIVFFAVALLTMAVAKLVLQRCRAG